MAKVKIQGHASGTGVLTVTAPNTSTDRTITLPDDTGTLISSTHTGDLTLDVSGDIILDADGGDIFLKDAGTTFGTLSNDAGYFDIKSTVSDQDISFKGNDGGSAITALRLDMSEGGRAVFNNGVAVGGTGAANTLEDYEEGTWSPTPSKDTSAPTLGTYTSRSGSYIKIGNVVWIHCYFRMDAISGGSGGWTITNLPFAPMTGGNETGQNVLGHYNYINGVDQTSTNGNVCRWQANNSSYFAEYSTTAATTHTSGVFLKGFTGCYRTS